jgi:hypothetical protein
MNEINRVIEQLFTTPTFIEGLSIGHLMLIAVGVLSLIGAVVVLRVFGEFGGCILRVGCVLGVIFLLAVIGVVLFLNAASLPPTPAS